MAEETVYDVVYGTPQPLPVRDLRTMEGATFTPWTDGYAVGYCVTAPGRPTRYIYLNPSSAVDQADEPGNLAIDHTNAFLYIGEAGDPSIDQSHHYYNIWDDFRS